jgi:sugar phosphate isomerase/epimerase
MMNSPRSEVANEIEFAGRHGFQGFELVFEYPKTTPEKVLDRKSQIADAFSQYDLVKVAHTQAFVNISDCYESLRRASLQETVKAMEAAYKVEVRFLTVHPGFLWPIMAKREAMQKSIEALKEIMKVAEEFNLTVGVENLPPMFFPPSGYFSTAEEFDTLFSQIISDRLKLVLDIAHTSFRDAEPPLNFISKFYEKLGHVHLSDNLGERDDHLPLGVGRVDYKSPIKQLLGRNYDKTVTLEVFTEDRDYLLLSKRKLEDLMTIR